MVPAEGAEGSAPAVGGAATALGATTAWLTAQGPRTSTVTLVGLVGSQLGQIPVASGRDPRVLTASLGTAAALGAIITTPGLSQLFGCRPLGPVGWTIGLGSGALATGTAAAANSLL